MSLVAHEGAPGILQAVTRVQTLLGSRSLTCHTGAGDLTRIRSSMLPLASASVIPDDSLGLNCAWYADVLMTLDQDRRVAAAIAMTARRTATTDVSPGHKRSSLQTGIVNPLMLRLPHRTLVMRQQS